MAFFNILSLYYYPSTILLSLLGLDMSLYAIKSVPNNSIDIPYLSSAISNSPKLHESSKIALQICVHYIQRIIFLLQSTHRVPTSIKMNLQKFRISLYPVYDLNLPKNVITSSFGHCLWSNVNQKANH